MQLFAAADGDRERARIPEVLGETRFSQSNEARGATRQRAFPHKILKSYDHLLESGAERMQTLLAEVYELTGLEEARDSATNHGWPSPAPIASSYPIRGSHG
jgi:hypothetical protein